MGYSTKVQLIKRKVGGQWYVCLPTAVAQAMDFVKGETVQWTVGGQGSLILSRTVAPSAGAGEKKTPAPASPHPL